MSYNSQPNLDASTESGRTQEIQKLNELQAPEGPRLGTGTGNEADFKYFQLSKYSRFSFQYQSSTLSAALSSIDFKIYVTWDAVADATTAKYFEVTQAFEHIPDGAAPEVASRLYKVFESDGAGPFKGAFVDTKERFKGATYIMIEWETNDAYIDISKNVRVI